MTLARTLPKCAALHELPHSRVTLFQVPPPVHTARDRAQRCLEHHGFRVGHGGELFEQVLGLDIGVFRDPALDAFHDAGWCQSKVRGGGSEELGLVFVDSPGTPLDVRVLARPVLASAAFASSSLCSRPISRETSEHFCPVSLRGIVIPVRGCQ